MIVRALFVMVLAYVFIDLLRRFLDGNKFALALVDVALVGVYAAHWLRPDRSAPGLLRSGTFRGFAPFLTLYVATVALGALDMTWFFLSSRLLGLHNYLITLPCLAVGYRLSTTTDEPWRDRAVFRRLRWLFFAVVGFGLIGFFARGRVESDNLSQVLNPMAHTVHSFEGGEQILSASFFASSWRLAIYVIGMSLVLWAAASQRRRSTLWLHLAALVGLYVSGNRTTISIYLVFFTATVLIFYLGSRRLVRGRIVGSLFAPICLLFVALMFSTDISRIFLDTQEFDVRVRSQYLLRTGGEYTERMDIALSPLYLRWENPDLYFGLGVGAFGQEIFLAPTLDARKYFFVDQFFLGRGRLGLADSGLTKITIDLGLVGLFVWLVYLGAVVFFCIKGLLRATLLRDPSGFALAFFPLVWVVMFLKGHQTLSDLGTNAASYLAFGANLRRLDMRGGEKKS